MYYLLCDDEFFNKVIKVSSRRAAIKYIREFLSMKGRIRIIEDSGNNTTYKMDKSDYVFTLTLVRE